MTALTAPQAVVASRLATLGYPPSLALRVALTPPLNVKNAPLAQDDSRPGRDLAEAMERRTPEVVEALLFWERWAP